MPRPLRGSRLSPARRELRATAQPAPGSALHRPGTPQPVWAWAQLPRPTLPPRLGLPGLGCASPSDRAPGAGPSCPQGPNSLLSHIDSPSATCVVGGRTCPLVFQRGKNRPCELSDSGGRRGPGGLDVERGCCSSHSGGGHTQAAPPASTPRPAGPPCLRGGCPTPARGTLTSSKKERELMAMLRLWAPRPCAPSRCSVSDTVPIRRMTTGSLLRKKPSRKGGSCRLSRLPWGRGPPWDGARGLAARAPSPALPLGPRLSVRRPSLGPHPPGRLHAPPPPGTRPGRVLWTAPSPLSPGRPRPSGSINPTLAGSWAPPSPVPVRTRGPLAWSQRPPLFSSTPPCLPPLCWPPHGSEEVGGAGPDKSVSRTYWGHQLPTSPGAQCAGGGCGPPGSQ